MNKVTKKIDIIISKETIISILPIHVNLHELHSLSFQQLRSHHNAHTLYTRDVVSLIHYNLDILLILEHVVFYEYDVGSLLF